MEEKSYLPPQSIKLPKPARQTGTRVRRKKFLSPETLSSRADELLVSVAVLGLVATIADGQAEKSEVAHFMRVFRTRFALSRSAALRIISVALRKVRHSDHIKHLACAIDNLNEHLNTHQKLQLFESLAEILVIDGVVHENEERFLDHVADKLSLGPALQDKFSKEATLN